MSNGSTEKTIEWALPTAEELVSARFELKSLKQRIADFDRRHPHLNFLGTKTEAPEGI